MSDQDVRDALRSEARLVVIEAPAGCGKTHQGAEFASDLAEADRTGRPLILTHTHAACSTFAERTRRAQAHIDIRTIDSLVVEIASAYHIGLGLPADPATWAREHPKNGFAQLCQKTAKLLNRHPMIARALALRHRTVVCDEHQDATGDQHTIVSALMNQGARLRIFADPMQRVFRNKPLKGASPACEWEDLKANADIVRELGHPHRWEQGCSELGKWTLQARSVLKSGGSIDLTKDLPASVAVVFAENQAKRRGSYQVPGHARRAIDAFQERHSSLLVLTRYNRTTRSIRAFFNRRIPLWEGHVRTALDRLVVELNAKRGDLDGIAAAAVAFLNDVGKGLGPSTFGDRFKKEINSRCAKPAKGRPARIQELARLLLDQPDHRGVARMLRQLAELSETDPVFADIAIDCRREFWDAVKIGGYETADAGLAEITNRRTHARPMPPPRAISTIHKAKGLEREAVIVMPCDATTLPEGQESRCLLYVALSRATRRLMLVASRENPTPLLTIS